MCRYFLRHRIREPLSCVLKSFFGYFHPGVGFKAVSIKLPFKNVEIFQFFGKAKSLRKKSQNNDSARAIQILVHFFVVL